MEKAMCKELHNLSSQIVTNLNFGHKNISPQQTVSWCDYIKNNFKNLKNKPGSQLQF